MSFKPDFTDEEIAELVPTLNSNDDPSKSTESKALADRMIALVQAQGIELFHDQNGENFAWINRDGFGEIIKIEGKDFSRWMAGLFWRNEQKAINNEALRSATIVFSAQAQFDGKEHELYNRVAIKDGEIWYDLADAKSRAVRIGPEGWTIVDAPPILFRRYNHQAAQVDPLPGGELQDMLRFTNLANDSQGLLLLIVLISYLIPNIPHPVLVVHGPQGSAKTTLLRIVRRLIDPSKTETLSLSSDKNELIQQLSHQYAPAYDNVSQIPESISDALCRAVTGEGHSKRELYTNDDDIIYQFRRCILLNGINVAARKPDLLSRSILVELKGIPDERRQTEEIVYREFAAARPRLLGAMFTILSKAMSIIETINPPILQRMADFAKWGCAIAQVLGFGEQTFLQAIQENAGLGHEEAINDSLVAYAIQGLMQDRTSWEGTPQELHTELESIAERLKVNTRVHQWPKAANSLMRKLNEIATDLLEIGIQISTGERTGKRRKVTLLKLDTKTVTTVTSAPSGVNPIHSNNLSDRDDSDDISGNIALQTEHLPQPENENWQSRISRRIEEAMAEGAAGHDPSDTS